MKARRMGSRKKPTQEVDGERKRGVVEGEEEEQIPQSPPSGNRVCSRKEKELSFSLKGFHIEHKDAHKPPTSSSK